MQSSRWLVSACLVLAASEASAQTRPVITPLSAISPASQVLNIEEIERNDPPIRVSWRAGVDFTYSYEFELSYDRARSADTSTVTLILLDDSISAGRNEGQVISNQPETFAIRPKQIVPREALPGGSSPRSKATRDIVLQVFASGDPGDDLTSATYVWKFGYDTLRPAKPTITAVTPGEERLEITWEPPADSDVEFYDILYCPDAGTSTGTLSRLPCDTPTVKENISATQRSFSVSDGLVNDRPAAVAMRAVDEAGNDGALSSVVVAAPKEVTDFYELYKEEGGSEDGGFCFIATAAYGSYAHPTVRVLRLFRDLVLRNVPGGPSLIELYYERSPPLAARIAADEGARSWVRLALLPVAALALLVMLAPIFGLSYLGFRGLRRAWGARARWTRRLGRTRVPLLLLPILMGAQLIGEDQADAARPEPTMPRFGLGFEFKGGPYLPALGDEAGDAEGVTAFREIFGSQENPLYTLGVDLQLFRAFGTAGIGGTFGFMQWVGRGLFPDTRQASPDTTVFNLAPFTLSLFYRFDWIADHTPVPIVPYFEGGLAYYLWWVTTGTGDVARWDGTDPSSSADDRKGRGGKFGYTGTLGVAVLLNTFDPGSAQSLYASTGIRGTYLFAELQGAKVDGFGSAGFDLSDFTWSLGLYLEL